MRNHGKFTICWRYRATMRCGTSWQSAAEGFRFCFRTRILVDRRSLIHWALISTVIRWRVVVAFLLTRRSVELSKLDPRSRICWSGVVLVAVHCSVGLRHIRYRIAPARAMLQDILLRNRRIWNSLRRPPDRQIIWLDRSMILQAEREFLGALALSEFFLLGLQLFLRLDVWDSLLENWLDRAVELSWNFDGWYLEK